MKQKNRVKIFERAYDKCAILQPGQDINLSQDEEYILLYCIRARQKRIGRSKLNRVNMP
jgi:hypothetical protein